ncbi:hypothetical protein GCM10027294_53050 [Marinactinospora endophytica]
MSGRTETVGTRTFRMRQGFARSVPAHRFTTTQSAILFAMIGRAEHGNLVPMLVKEIAEAVGAQPQNVSKAMRALKDRGLIWMVSTGMWRISPYVGFVGSDEEWYEAFHSIPDDVPPVVDLDYKRPPPRRRGQLRAVS